MKKFFILAAAAVVATAACTKSEVVEAPEKAISFEVAKYATATKAASYNSLLDETANGAAVTNFYTNAWCHTTGYSAQQTMADQSIVPNDATNPTQWNTDGRTYYWPKTGYLNFFSYAGYPLPTAKAEGSVTYSGVTVDRNANILVADAAYGYKENTTNANPPYQQNSVTKGVPTLFHHMLSRVKFDVIFDASAITDASYAYTVTIKTASISVPQVGTLAVNFTEPANVATTPQVVALSTTGWSSLGSYAAIDKVSGDVVLTAKGGNKSDGSTTDGTATGTPVELITESSAISHALSDDVTFSMTYTFSYKYGSEAPVTEDVTITATKLKEFAPSVSTWAMNTKYLYHIIIKPNEPIIFDPAVETWVAETNEPEYTY